ncbi:hypothetical protein M3Y94_00077800 [Aphelenchoides besseyi]|nr:hypothetical protein M3Y94_00077800 [Aphelenchoides besseyi]KAI6237816.1 hypothetical protein M3Y95_00304600 [Aphelenchoides besseyi]
MSKMPKQPSTEKLALKTEQTMEDENEGETKKPTTVTLSPVSTITPLTTRTSATTITSRTSLSPLDGTQPATPTSPSPQINVGVSTIDTPRRSPSILPSKSSNTSTTPATPTPKRSPSILKEHTCLSTERTAEYGPESPPRKSKKSRTPSPLPTPELPKKEVRPEKKKVSLIAKKQKSIDDDEKLENTQSKKEPEVIKPKVKAKEEKSKPKDVQKKVLKVESKVSPNDKTLPPQTIKPRSRNKPSNGLRPATTPLSRYFPDNQGSVPKKGSGEKMHEKSINISAKELEPRRRIGSDEKIVDTGKVVNRRRKSFRPQAMSPPAETPPKPSTSAGSDDEAPTIFENDKIPVPFRPAVFKFSRRWEKKQPIKLTRKKPLGTASDQIGSMREEPVNPRANTDSLPSYTPVSQTPSRTPSRTPAASPPKQLVQVKAKPKEKKSPHVFQPIVPVRASTSTSQGASKGNFGRRLARILRPRGKQNASRHEVAGELRVTSDPKSGTASTNTAQSRHSSKNGQPK